MTEQIKRQIIKALAYGKSKEKIKENLGLTDEDISSVTPEEVIAEKDYYREMGYIK